MFRRPRPDETEEDLLQMQMELQASSEFVPSAQVVRIGTTGNAAGREDSVAKQLSLHSRVTTVEDGVVERQFDPSVPVEPPRRAEHADAFPKAMRRAEDYASVAERSGEKKKRSIFAQQLAAKRANTQNVAASNASSNEGQSAPAGDKMEASNAIQMALRTFGDESVLGRLPQRVVGTKEIDKIHEENTQFLASFSKDEILEEQKRLLATLGSNTVAFLRALRASAAQAPQNETVDKTTQQLNNEQAAAPDIDATTLHGTCCGKRHVEGTGKTQDSVELAVDATGQPAVIRRLQETDAETYSLDELARLTRSVLARQRSFAFTLLRRAFSLSITQRDVTTLRRLLDADLASIARHALDDNTAQCVADGVNLMHMFTQCDSRLLADRVARRLVCPFGSLRFCETLVDENESESESRASDAELARRGDAVHAFSVRMRIAARLAFLVRDANLHVSTARVTRERAFELACVTASHCAACAERFYDARILDVLVNELDVASLAQTDAKACRLATLLGDLFSSVAAASRRFADRLERRFSLLERFFVPALAALRVAMVTRERVAAQRSISDAVSLLLSYRLVNAPFFFTWLLDELRNATDAQSHVSLVRMCDALFANANETEKQSDSVEYSKESEVVFDLICTQLLSVADNYRSLLEAIQKLEINSDAESATAQIDLFAHLLSAVATFFGNCSKRRLQIVQRTACAVQETLNAALNALPPIMDQFLQQHDNVHLDERCVSLVSVLTACLRFLHATCTIPGESSDSTMQDSVRTLLSNQFDAFSRLLVVIEQCAKFESQVDCLHGTHKERLLRSISNATLANCNLLLTIIDALPSNPSPQLFDFALSLLSLAHTNRQWLHLHRLVIQSCLPVLFRKNSLRLRANANELANTVLAFWDEKEVSTCFATFLVEPARLDSLQSCLDVHVQRDTFFIENQQSKFTADVHWSLVPLLSSFKRRAAITDDTKAVVQSTLSAFALLDSVDKLAVRPLHTVVYTMLMYLVGTDCYLDNSVRQAIASLVTAKVRQSVAEGRSETPSEFRLQTAYSELLLQYEAASYNEVTFANLLLLPFVLPLTKDDALACRRLLVVHNSTLFRSLPLSMSSLLVPVEVLFSETDLETEVDLLETYATLVLLEKPRSSVIYSVCVHKICTALYATVNENTHASFCRFRFALIKRLEQATRASQTDAVRDLLLYNKTDSTGNLLLYSPLPEQRAKHLRLLLRSAQVETSWLTDSIFDELTLKFLLEFI